MEQKQQVVGLALQIDELSKDVINLWENARKLISEGDVDGAISLLNAYFGKKETLEGMQAKLASILHSHFADK